MRRPAREEQASEASADPKPAELMLSELKAEVIHIHLWVNNTGFARMTEVSM